MGRHQRMTARTLRAALVLGVLAMLLPIAPFAFGAKPVPAKPVLSTVTPGYGAPGTEVVLTGTGFGTRPSGDTVVFGDVAGVNYTQWTDTRIAVLVPAGAQQDGVYVLVNKVASNTLPFTPWGPPNLVSVSPNPARLGSQVTLSGVGFGAVQGTSYVTFNGATASAVTSWTDTQIILAVPSNTTAGPVVVHRGAFSSNPVSFTPSSGPWISALSASEGEAGTPVTISGSAFGSAQGLSTVTFNSAPASVTAWSDTSITAIVPGSGPVRVTCDGAASNDVPFAVFVRPSILSIDPATARVGSSVTVRGSAFGAAQGTGTVTFGGTPAAVSSWSDGAIVVTVPGDGPVVVTAAGHASAGVAFTSIAAPAITGVSPGAAEVGTVVTISGTGFGAAQGASTVTFNGVAATAASWSDTAITVAAPGDGPVVVTCDGSASNAAAFNAYAPAVVTGLSQDYAIVGDTIAITGTGFGTVPGKVIIAGKQYDALTWTDTSVTFRVPDFNQGYVGVLVDGVASNGIWSTHAPRVDSISPAWAAEGTDVTIQGVGFGPAGSGWAALAGQPVTVVSWTDTVVVVRMPAGASSGYLGIVRDFWATSNGKYLGILVPAQITAVSETNLVPGQQVTVTGTRFGGPTATSEVRIGSVTCPVVTWTDTSIVFTVPEFSGTAYLGVYLQGCPSNGVSVTRSTKAPTVTSLSAPWALAGQSLTLYGSGFGASQGVGAALVSGAPATVVSWSDTAVTVVVPSGADAGYAGIYQNGLSSNGAFFVPFEPPVISAISTPAATVGDRVTVTGTAFGASPGVLSVGGAAVSVVSWSDTQVAFDVPAGLASGYVGVTRQGSTSNGKWLDVR